MTTKLRFGTYAQVFPPIQQSLGAAQLAEKQGWDFIDFPDQMASTHAEGMIPTTTTDSTAPVITGGISSTWYGPFPLMSASAMVTRSIELQCAVIDPLRRSPSVFAQEAVTVDHICEGRATWCIGSGEAKQFEPFGEKRSQPIARLREAVRVMNALWDSDGKPVSRDSDFWPLRDAIFPLPLRDGKHKPKILMVGGGDDTYRLAGELCDGWYTFLPGGGLDETRQAISKVKQAAADNGRDPETLRFGALLLMALAENDDLGWHYARTPQAAWASLYAAGVQSGAVWKAWGYEHPFGDGTSWPKNMAVNRLPDAVVNGLPDLVPHEVTNRSIFWGGPDRVAETCLPYLDAGITEVTFLSFVPWADTRYSAHFAAHASTLITHLGGKPLNLDV
ncbi:hypothetical protein A5662_12065 [Mycobacteriaceae bacterium 1482268.1]|nr:hypothetical protein A5662_12065 [Mycobacteriaceae bacterium 1482268.1]